jgi:large subunit ribosomal protein L6
MSRLGKLPVVFGKDVSVTLNGNNISVAAKGQKLNYSFPDDVEVKVDSNNVIITPNPASKNSKAMWGTVRSRIANMVQGVEEGFTKVLESNGVGYRQDVKGDFLILYLGHSHEIYYHIPAGITIRIEKPNRIIISGADKQLVGRVAAQIRKFRKPEPYKGKGLKYEKEVILRKEGKKK